MSASVNVYTSFDLQREVELGTPHIVVLAHLDLTQLSPVDLSSRAGEVLVIRSGTLSIRVRSASILRIARLLDIFV
jgi:hypothetical protein